MNKHLGREFVAEYIMYDTHFDKIVLSFPVEGGLIGLMTEINGKLLLWELVSKNSEFDGYEYIGEL